MVICIYVATVASSAHADASLTPIESRWIDAGRPVVAYAKRLGLPLDILVQPTADSSAAPISLGFVDGRCKLVLTLRDRPDAEAAFGELPEEVAPVLIEAMTAHEIGHCYRYVRGAWHTLPAGFSDSGDRADDEREIAVKRRDMREQRREEGYADLVALAWTLAQHPTHYEDVQTWFEHVRNDKPGEHHDTRAWLHLVRDRAAFPPAKTPFEQVRTLWKFGLVAED